MWNNFYLEDFRVVAEEIPTGTVDLLFADPLFYPSYIWQYGEVAKIAHRVLRHGGSLVIEFGVKHMGPVLKQVMGHGLHLHWQLVTVYGDSKGPRATIRDRGIEACYTPYLWFTKGRVNRSNNIQKDLVPSAYQKELYVYQDSVEEIAGIFKVVGVKKGDKVFDPFGGSGTVGAVAARMGVDFISCDTNPAAYKIAQQRLRPLGIGCRQGIPRPAHLELVAN